LECRLVSERAPSRAENILVRRLVIEGFSVVVYGALAGSEGGAEPLPRTLRLSVLEMPFRPAEGRDSGDPTAEDAWEVAGDERGLSGTRASRWAVTVAMVAGGA
jgi:hypothetical protein